MAFSQRFSFRFLRFALLSFCVLLLSIASSTAQHTNTIWEAPAKTGSALSEKAGKKISALKKWKDHLQKWGLDTGYHHAVFAEARLNTNGWSGGIFYQKPVGDEYDRKKGRHSGQSQFYRLSFSEVKHEKEVKQQRENTRYPELGNGSPFIYGKINNLYLLQLGYGREQLLLPGILQGNISLSFRYNAGLSLALLKPYYVRLLYVDYASSPERAWSQEERYTDGNKDIFLNRDRVLGTGKWSKGLEGINYIPGAYLEGAFAIMPAKGKAFVQLITIGGQVSVYSQNLRIMADQKAYPFLASFHVGLAVGKRW